MAHGFDRQAIVPAAAATELVRCAGGQFDPTVADAVVAVPAGEQVAA